MLSVHFARGTEDRKYSCLINMSYVGTRRTIFNGCEWYCNIFFNGINAIHSCTSVCLINLSTMWFCSQGLQLAVRYKNIGLTPIIQFSSIVDRSVHQTRKKNHELCSPPSFLLCPICSSPLGRRWSEHLPGPSSPPQNGQERCLRRSREGDQL